MDGYIDRQALQDIADAIREKNGSSDTYKPSEMAEAILDLSGNINLQDKQVAITENGTQTITADEGFDGLSSVEVNTNVPVVGYDFSKIYSGEEKAEFDELYNELFAEEISYAKQIKNYVENNNKTNWTNLCLSIFANPTFIPSFNVIPTVLNRAFTNCRKVRKMSYIDTSKTADFSYTWSGMDILYIFPSIDCSNGTNFTCTFQDSPKITSLFLNIKKAINMSGTFVRCSSLKEIDPIGTDNVTNFGNTFYGCTKLKKLKLSRVDKAYEAANNGFGNTFYNMSSLESLEFDAWKKYPISLSSSSKLTPQSIHYIIQNAMSVADGATARTLTLHATAKANWVASEYYEQDLAVLEEKGITIA